MSTPWSRLGILPTQDLLAIKKAYAAALKKTRPDDDPQGYQALRQAYEFAQAYARQPAATLNVLSMSAVDVDALQKAASSPASVGTEPFIIHFSSEPPVQVRAESTADVDGGDPHPREHPPWREPEALVREFEDVLETGEPDRIPTAWEKVRIELDQLPLSLRQDASRRFARLMADTSAPMSSRAAVANYFEWFSDYRASDILGPRLSNELRVAIGDAVDPGFVRRFQQVADLALDHRRLWGWRAQLLALGAPSQLRIRWKQLCERESLVLGAERAANLRLTQALRTTGFLRIGAVLAIAASCLGWKGYQAFPWIGKLVTVSVMAGVAALVTFVASTYLSAGRTAFAMFVGLRDPAGTRTRLSAADWAGTAAVVCALGVTGWAESRTRLPIWPGVPALLLIALAGLLARWPLTAAGEAAPGIFVLCLLVGVNVPGLEALPWTGACLGALWFWVCANAFSYFREPIERRWGAGSGRAARRPFLQAIVVQPLRLSVGWPYALLLLAQERSHRLVMAGCGITLAAASSVSMPWVWPIWMLATASVVVPDTVVARNTRLALFGSGDERLRAWGWLILRLSWWLWAVIYLSQPAAVHNALKLKPAVHSWETALRILMLVAVVPGTVCRVFGVLAKALGAVKSRRGVGTQGGA